MTIYPWPSTGGVSDIDGLTGSITLAAGSGITITPSGNTLTIASTAGGGSVTSVSVVTANGVSGSVANPTTTPAITLTLGAITPSSVAASGAVSGSNLSGTNTGDVSLGTANGLSLSSQVLSLGLSSTSTTGALSSTDWNTFNSKQSSLTLGNLTDAGTDGIVVTGGTGAVVGSGTSIAQHVADSTHNGYLSSADWSTFNSKQAAGNYITNLTGDATASGPGSVPVTFATVNTDVGSFGDASHSPSFTVNGKGLVTAASSSSIQIAESQVTNLVSDLAAKQSTTLTSAHLLVGNGSNVATDVAASGDLTLDNTGAFTIINAPHKRYIDFISGDDTTGTGSATKPWKTLQHAYNSSSPTINEPYTFFLSGGNNDTDAGTITGKPNVTLYSEAGIQVSAPLTISGGITNDNIAFINVTFVGAVTWIRNDATAMGVFMQNAQFFSGPVIKQQGAGGCAITAYYCTTVNMDVILPTYGVFQGHTFLGSMTFGDVSSAAYYEIMSGYNSSSMSISGGPELYFSGVAVDVPFGATLTVITTANGTALLQADSGSLPPSITGSPTITLISQAKYENYPPTTSGNWNSVPASVQAGLDTLATSGVVKSQSQNLVLASPNGSSGVPSFRALVAGDLPGGTGTVTSVSVVSANGLAGSVATATTTPAITLSTTITGILQGNGTAISAATTGNLTDAGTDGIVVTGGTGSVLGSGTSIAQHVADATHNGYLSSADWSTFNGKQAAGNYITALTGDVTASGPGSVAATIANNAVTNAKLAQAATLTLKGNNTGGTANVADLTVAQVNTMLGDILANGSVAFGADQSFGGFKATNVADPTAAQDAATKNYVDTVASQLNPKQAAYAGSTANIVGTYTNGAAGIGSTFTVTATGAFSIDGVTPPVLSRILLKDQTSGFQNGVYDLTVAGSLGVSPILTRSLDYDTATNMNAGDLIPVINGTVNQKTSWLQTATITTVGSDSLTFIEWSYNPATLLGNALTSAHLFVGNGSNVATDVAVSGDLTLANTGAFTVAKIQTTTVSGTTGSGNVVFSASPTLTGTLSGSAASFSSTIGASNFSGTSSGTNTGDQTITLTGDVTGSGTGSFAATIANLAVTNAKIANSTIDLTAKVTGTLPIANGGTNSATALNSNRIMVSSSGSIVEAAALTNGQLLIGSTGAAPVAAALTAGSNITITNAAGSITIASTGGGSTAENWAGYHANDNTWTFSGSTSYVDAGATTGTFTQTTNNSFGTVTSALSGGNKLPGITWTPTAAGVYKITMTFSTNGGSNDNFQLIDESSNVIDEVYYNVGSYGVISMNGLVTAANTSAKTVKLQAKNNPSSSVQVGGSFMARSASWVIYRIQ